MPHRAALAGRKALVQRVVGRVSGRADHALHLYPGPAVATPASPSPRSPDEFDRDPSRRLNLGKAPTPAPSRRAPASSRAQTQCWRLPRRHEAASAPTAAAVESNPSVSAAQQLGQEVRVVDRRRPLLALCGGVFRADAVDFRGADFRAVDFLGAPVPVVSDLSDVAGLRTGWPSDRLLNWWTTSPVPPTASRSGHSTRPAAPTTPRVNAAAGVEWLPLATPLRIPDTAPWRPPIAPLIAAPPTAPAAEVVALAVRVTRARYLERCPSCTSCHHGSPAVSRLAINQATRVLTVLTCGISVARGFRTAAARRD
jgi:hypothetical protein